MSSAARTTRVLTRVLLSPWAIALAFVAAHVWLIGQAWTWADPIFGDVRLYEWWVREGISSSRWPVFDYGWVYPVGALLTITPPGWITQSTVGYEWAWLGLITLLDAVATVLLVRARPRGPIAAWFWIGFLTALGPIFLGRLDGAIAPIMIVALLIAGRHPATAMTLATIGAWIKIAPGAVAVAIAATSRSWYGFARNVVIPGATVTTLVLMWALAMGSGERVLEVFGAQSDRSLQVEAVGATPFLLMGLENPRFDPTWNDQIFTYEILGTAPDALAEALDVALPVVVLLIAALAWLAVRRRPDRAQDVLLLTAAAELFALIVFNKVGSPQFIAWLGPPVAVGIALFGSGGRRSDSDSDSDDHAGVVDNRSDHGGVVGIGSNSRTAARRTWLPPALGLLVTAYLTQLIFPTYYGEFLGGFPEMILIGAVRNAIVVALLLGAIARLVQIMASGRRRKEVPAQDPMAAPAVQEEQDDT